MKLYLFSIAFFIFSCSVAQQKYSTSSKKAIALFEEALQTPQKNINPKTGRPDYQAGIDMLKKALEKDNQFWEAHVASAELYEESGNANQAIFHYVVVPTSI